MNIYYDKDADLELVRQRTVAVLGYGSQGHAHANNLRDSGVPVLVGLRDGSASRAKAEAAGLEVRDLAGAAAAADVVMVLAPDEHQKALYEAEIEPHIRQGATLAFAHGFNIHFEQIRPRADLDVIMIAPKGPGHLVRSTYLEGGGVPTLIAVFQDASGQAKQTALSYASANGGGRAGIIETSFREETETDLFGEQAVLVGGVTAMIESGFETLVEAGYAPEMAYFECLHELKLIVDLIYEGGISNMNYSVSNTAEYGGFTRGPKVIGAEARAAMRQILADVQSGAFAREWVAENAAGAKRMRECRAASQGQQVERVGAELRAMMPWIRQRRLVDRDGD